MSESRCQCPNPEELIGRPFVLGFLASTNFPSSHRNPGRTKIHSSTSYYNSLLLLPHQTLLLHSPMFHYQQYHDAIFALIC